MSNDNFIDALSVLTALHPTLPREQGHALYVLMQHAMADREKRAQAAQGVAYLDIGAGGYVDLGSDLTPEQLQALPYGRHVLAIVGTFGVDGYVAATEASKPVLPEAPTRNPMTLAEAAKTFPYGPFGHPHVDVSNPVQAEAPRCSYPQCTGEQPADGSCCKQPFTSAMADAAERYWRAVGPNAHPLPAQFRWVDCFRAMEAAAPSPKASNPEQVAQDGDLLALLEEVSRHYTREDDLPDNLLPRIDAAIDAARTRGEGA